VVQDTTLLQRDDKYFIGTEGSQAALARPSYKGRLYKPPKNYRTRGRTLEGNCK
jgi:hypothetical protein